MTWLKRHWGFLAAALAIAAAVHVASVTALPHLIMLRVFAALARDGGFNTMHHGARATARSRLIVRPSPDLLYSTCPYDLDAAGGRLAIRAHGMPDTYWSVSLFDANTNNFFVLNDAHAQGNVDIALVAPDAPIAAERQGADGGALRVVSPTRRGVVLIRTLINQETHLADIDAARRRATCEAER